MENQNTPQPEDLSKQNRVPDSANTPGENTLSEQTASQSVTPTAASMITPGVPKAMPPNYKPYVPRSQTPEYQAFKSRVVSVKGLVVTIFSILLAILFTETIFLGSAGISVPIFAVAYYTTLFYFFHENNKPISKPALFLTVPVFLLAFSFFLHYNPSTQFITWLTLIALVCIQLVMLGTNPAEGLFSFDMFIKVMVNVIGRSFSNLGMPFVSFEVLKGKRTKASRNTMLILIGLAVSLPVAVILMGLFMSADAVFEKAVNNVIDFAGLDLGNIFADVFLGFWGGIFLSAALLGLKYEEEKQKSAGKVGNNIDRLVIGTFLTIINICLIAFVGFQFAYLFGGTANITLTDMTYAEYARRGFFELTAASAIIFTIALLVLIMTKKIEDQLPVWVKLCTVSLCLCNGVLLVSAVKRMLLYVDAYGLSVKRVLTLWLMCLIALCLVWMIIKCFAPKIDVMRLIGVTVVAAVCILSLTNTEKLIARYNIDRYISDPTKITIDIYHLGSLSYTTSPEIARLKEVSGGQFTRVEIIDILNSQKAAFESRNALYGFTLDSLKAGEVFSGLTK
ncbi:MAG: hypothetical protein K0R50_4737 [Eubacterium sp.]|jgi:hypothetical protein|nr:hypothetical protein [Eubacterium sp.]